MPVAIPSVTGVAMSDVRLQDLPDMSDVDVTHPAFRAALVTAGRFLSQEGLTDLVAIGAGHRHFNVSADEALLEETDTPSYLFTTRIVPRDQVDSSQEVAWRFTPSGKPVATVWSAQPKGVDVLSPEFRDVLAKVGAFLVREELIHTLVVKPRGTSVPLAPGWVLREYTNPVSRIQMTIPTVLVPSEERFAADWMFTSTGEPIVQKTCWLSTHPE